MKNILKKYLTNRKRQDIMKPQTKKNNSSKILEINLTRNLKKGGTVQWDSNQNLKKLKSKNDRKEVRTNGTVSGIRRDQKES